MKAVTFRKKTTTKQQQTNQNKQQMNKQNNNNKTHKLFKKELVEKENEIAGGIQMMH